MLTLIMLLLSALVMLGTYVFSWFVTCCLIYFICICFDLVFSWYVATGIWLLMVLVSTIFAPRRK